MITYRESELKAPMNYQRFKELPKTAQQQYLDFLRAEFYVTDAAISAMMGAKQNTFSYYCKSHGLEKTGRGKISVSEAAEYSEKWDKFIAGFYESSPETLVDEEGEETLTPTDPPPEPAEQHAEEDKREADTMSMPYARLTFKGLLDPFAIANSLRFILGGDSRGTITVIFNRDGEDDIGLPF